VDDTKPAIAGTRWEKRRGYGWYRAAHKRVPVTALYAQAGGDRKISDRQSVRTSNSSNAGVVQISVAIDDLSFHLCQQDDSSGVVPGLENHGVQR
jgi:hypothetical protein